MAMIALAAGLLVVAGSASAVLPAALLMGLGIGADLPVSLATISEAADDGQRGRMLVFTNLLWIAGIATALVLVAAVGDRADLVTIVFSGVAATAAVVFVARLTVPESRVWRVAREERRAGLTTIRAQRSGARVLLSAPYAKPFVGLVVFYALTNLIANTNSQFGTYVLVNFGGATIAEASRVLLVSIPLIVIGLLWFLRIADRGVVLSYFRVGAVCGVAAPLVLAVFGVSVPTYAAALVLGSVGTVFAFEAVMKIWTQQSFPTLVRGTAQGAIIAAARILAAGFAALTPVLLQVGTSLLYGVIAVAGAIGVTAAWLVFARGSTESAFLHEQEQLESAGRG